MKLTQKRIDVTISIGKGKFGAEGADTVKLTGHRTSVNISNAGGESMDALQMRIYGIKQDLMNQLTTIGPIATEIFGKNHITISAGDENGMSEVFTGTISQAWGDYQGVPEVSFNVIGLAGLIDAVKPIEPNSYPGPSDVGTIMGNLAKTMGVRFENHGVTTPLSNPYFPGTAWQQVQACARAADCRFALDRGILAIWPKDGTRAGGIPVVSPETGMVGYPAFSSQGMELVMVYNPNIQIGGQVQVKSSLPMANGIWNISEVAHALESERPDGAWFTQIRCYPATPTGIK